LRNEHGEPRIVYWPYEQIIRDNFWKRGQSIVRCGTYPVQTIEVNEKEFADKLEAILKEKERSWLGRFMNKNQWRMIRMLAVFIVILVSAYISFSCGETGKGFLFLTKKDWGWYFNAIKPSFAIDAEKTAYINDFFRELNIDSKYNISITVVKENVTNAFAIPGGNIIVYDKIIAGMDGYEELSALLSHEFTHVNERHTTRSLFRQQASSLFISIIFGDVGTIGNVIVGSADDLKGLSYSRKLEKDADLNGIKILSERKLINGFIHLFELLEKEITETGGEPTEWISSHPDIEKRIAYTKANELFNRNSIEANETLKTLFMKIKTAN
jgi:Zn-dependent protease with chaperone function